MNPQFCKSVADRNGVRNEYIKNLQLETSNNLKNYNANQIFKQTGVLPPSITSMLDTRSITEKYADIQKAKIGVLSGLKEITDGANANQILDAIQGNDIIDLANNLPQIITDLKPKWSLGITAPAFLAYWDRYKSAIASNLGVSGIPILQSNQLLTDIQGTLQVIQATLATKAQYDILINSLREIDTAQAIATVRLAQRASEAGELLRQETEQAGSIADPIEQQEFIASLGEIAEVLPSSTEIQQQIDHLQIIQSTGTNPQQALEQALDMFSGLEEEEQSYSSSMVRSIASEPSSRALRPPSIVSSSSSSAVSERSPRETTYNVPSASSSLTNTPANSPRVPQSITSGMTTTSALTEPPQVYPMSFYPNYEKFETASLTVQKDILDYFIKRGSINPSEIQWGKARNRSGLQRGNFNSTNIPQLVKKAYEEPLALEPEVGKMGGTGLRKRGRPIIHGTGVKVIYSRVPKVDNSKKVEKVPSYIEFGKHLLNQHNLARGILHIRRRSGNILKDLPKQAIGGQLKKVLITLTGTGTPSFEDINELNTHEKEILNKVVKHCSIDQRLFVPTPDKTKEEQDINRLKILSGEITAGNNNPQIVKELKTLLLRLKNSGRIPKREAHEIMEDLLTLGY
jgi:hypothetical protein